VHIEVFYFAVTWMTVLLTWTVILLLRAKSAMVRILALDSLTLILVALLVLYTVANETPYSLDAALILAALSFVSPAAAERFHSEPRVVD
jgi:multicomponent Na+:H+ antiporter subunit F